MAWIEKPLHHELNDRMTRHVDRMCAAEDAIADALEAVRSDFPDVYWPSAIGNAIHRQPSDKLRDHYDPEVIIDVLQERMSEEV